MKNRSHRYCGFPRTGAHVQSGAALVFSLIILLIVTILGLAGLRTSSLEQLMAGNMQEAARALEVADSGVDWMLANPITFRTGTSWPYARKYPNDANPTATASVPAPVFLQKTEGGASTSPGEFPGTYFDQTVTSTTNTGARSTLVHGIVQLSTPPSGEFRDP